MIVASVRRAADAEFTGFLQDSQMILLPHIRVDCVPCGLFREKETAAACNGREGRHAGRSRPHLLSLLACPGVRVRTHGRDGRATVLTCSLPLPFPGYPVQRERRSPRRGIGVRLLLRETLAATGSVFSGSEGAGKAGRCISEPEIRPAAFPHRQATGRSINVPGGGKHAFRW